MKFEYSTQKSGLHGDILQVVPGLSTDSCPQTTWNQASEAEEIRKNQAAITGLDTKCAWNVSNLKIPANSAVTMSAKVAVGYTLDEIPNDITRVTPASFEPALDYVVVKVPRFAFEKFPAADSTPGACVY